MEKKQGKTGREGNKIVTRNKLQWKKQDRREKITEKLKKGQRHQKMINWKELKKKKKEQRLKKRKKNKTRKRTEQIKKSWRGRIIRRKHEKKEQRKN